MHWALLTYWRHRLATATWVGSAVLSVYVLLIPAVLYYDNLLTLLLVALHSIWIGIRAGRIGGAEAELLYSRGYSRHTLWLHAQVAAALAVLASCLPPALVIWLRFRSIVQEHFLQTAEFPFMAPVEDVVPLTWLLLYLLFVPLCSLAAARKDGSAGTILLTIGVGVSAFTLLNTRPMVAGSSGLIAIAAVFLIAGFSLWAVRAVQQRQEVNCD